MENVPCAQKKVHEMFIVCLCLIIIHHLGEADNSSAASVPVLACVKALKMGSSPIHPGLFSYQVANSF